MAKNADGQLELVLENRQLLVAFFVIVGLCGVFFSLGYIVGRNTVGTAAKAPQTATATAESASKPSPMPPPPEAAPNTAPPAATGSNPDGTGAQTDLNFYQSVEQKTPDGKLVPPETPATQGGTPGAAGSAPRTPAEKAPAPAAAPAPPAVSSTAPPASPTPAMAASASNTTGIGDGIMIQVSALTRREDANALLNILKEKKLPVQVLPGTTDTLYHVVVGPYKYIKDAEQAKASLEKDGFRPIFKK